MSATTAALSVSVFVGASGGVGGDLASYRSPCRPTGGYRADGDLKRSPRRQVSWLPGHRIHAAFPALTPSGRRRGLPGYSCGGSRGFGRRPAPHSLFAFLRRTVAPSHMLRSRRRQTARSSLDQEQEGEEARRHRAKMEKRKAVQDAEVAGKSIAGKGLLMVHTGAGKGKSTAAFGLALRALGHGWKIGVVQFGKGQWRSGERDMLEKLGGRSRGIRSARASPGRRRTAPATRPPPAAPGTRPVN